MHRAGEHVGAGEAHLEGRDVRGDHAVATPGRVREDADAAGAER
jgi:hypothetical protein